VVYYSFASFQFQFTTRLERFLLFLGFLGALGTGATQPLNVLLFGDLTGEMVAYGYGVLMGTNPDKDAFMDAVQNFSTLNSVLGFAMLVLTYLSIWTYNFVATRQVRTVIE
jgi:Fe2+ transport system protein B